MIVYMVHVSVCVCAFSCVGVECYDRVRVLCGSERTSSELFLLSYFVGSRVDELVVLYWVW